MKTLAIILLLIGIIILGVYYQYKEQEIIIEKEIEEICSEDNLAILNVEVLGIFENLYNSNEMFFDYRVDNYGNVEGKNIKVRCKLLDQNDNEIVSVSDNFGNLASKSVDMGEVVTKNTDYDEEGVYFCYIESCNNCKILYKEIPELVGYYK